ncbi:MAG: hypothetical protein MK212_05885 [Saprospiraceae bacterium]|nr:hypothetical protein [Saprospiraceae bacterium]
MKILLFLLSVNLLFSCNQPTNPQTPVPETEHAGDKTKTKSEVAKNENCELLLTQKVNTYNLDLVCSNMKRLKDCRAAYKLEEMHCRKRFVENLIFSINKDGDLYYEDILLEISKQQADGDYWYNDMVKYYNIINPIADQIADTTTLDKHRDIFNQLYMSETDSRSLKQLLQDTLASNPALKLSYDELLALNEQRTETLVNYLQRNKDYYRSIQLAKDANKPLLLYFNGYGSVNSRKMEMSTVYIYPILDYINKHYVVSFLLVDERRRLSAEDIKKYSAQFGSKILNHGNLNAAIQEEIYNTNTQPYWVIVNPNEETVIGTCGYTPSQEEFMKFLQKGK